MKLHPAVLCPVICALLMQAPPAQAQLEKTTATLHVDLAREARKYRPRPHKRPLYLKRGNFKGLFRYQADATRALLPLRDEIIRCVNVQRLLKGELRARLDFHILPTGKLEKLVIRRQEGLHACLLPQLPRVRFPRFGGRKRFVHMLGVASPGYRLGRRTRAKPVEAYALGDQARDKAYRMACLWVVGPWTKAMGDCAEWVDQSMGSGYSVWFKIGLRPSGRSDYLKLEVRGQQASEALKRLAPCVVPLARGLRAPRHQGKGLFEYRSGTRTSSWER